MGIVPAAALLFLIVSVGLGLAGVSSPEKPSKTRTFSTILYQKTTDGTVTHIDLLFLELEI